MNRRKFIKNIGMATGAAFVMPRFSIAQTKSPNETINTAFIGVGGIGGMSLNGMKSQNIVALCDLDLKYSAGNIKKHPDAKVFKDYREMLDKMGKDIDAVCISTPDHSHFKITLDCMQAGKHVATQKPLTHNIWQCRELARARKYYGKVQTQMLNQGHATEGIRYIKEWVDSGVCGPIREVHSMCSGPNWTSKYFKKPDAWPLVKEEIPEGFNWDMWVNQAKMNDYNRIYSPLTWRGFWDYGTGMLGDWFCHTSDAPVWSLDLKGDCVVELLDVDCSFDQKSVIPNSSTVKWTYPKNDKHPELAMYWYDGNKQPITRPHDYDADKKLPTSGMLMIGDKHTIETGSRPNTNPRMANSEFFAEFKKNMPPKSIPRAPKGDCYQEWIAAIKGEGPECGSNFEYAGQLTEVALLGVLVQRFGGKIEWDSKNMRVKNRPELAAFVKEPERKGWESAKF